MTTITKHLLETILRISSSASSDETRLYLCGVHVFKRDGSIIVEACDGYKAARETLINDESTIDDDLVLCRKDIKKIKKFITTYKAKQSFDCILNSHSLVVSVGTNTDIISIYRINREFPKLESVLPVKLLESDNAVSVSFNPEYLLELYNSLTLNKRQVNITLTFDSTNDLAPMIVEIEGNTDQVGVLMPCKSNRAQQSSEKFADKLNKKTKRSMA